MAFILTYRKPRSYSRKNDRTAAESVTQSSNVKQFSRQLLSFETLPDWCQDNPYIRAGYRPVSESWWLCVQSCTYLHNETLNIHTHLIPAILLSAAFVTIQAAISSHFPEASTLDRVVISANVLAAIVTFTFSSLYHTLMSHSSHVATIWLRIDYLGILTLILASFFSGIYVGFYCEPTPRTIYWSMIISLSVITAVLVLHPQLQGTNFRSHRTSAFVATALTGFAPIIHGLWLYGWERMWIQSGMPYYFLEGAIYLTGAFFFATRIPESVWPGSFDIWWSSHQIFHVLVVLASAVHLYGVWEAFNWHYHHPEACAAQV